MTKRFYFAIPSLIATGLTPLAASADDNPTKGISQTGSFLDEIEKIVSSIGESDRYTLAQHGSHVSHRSHHSHSAPLPPSEDEVFEAAPTSASTRNEASTPPSTILPSSPAIAKKLTVLPGNSKKFRELVLRTQLALVSRGYDVGEINGEVHARTVAAVYEYQSRSGLIPTGKITNETLGSLSITAQ